MKNLINLQVESEQLFSELDDLWKEYFFLPADSIDQYAISTCIAVTQAKLCQVLNEIIEAMEYQINQANFYAYNS